MAAATVTTGHNTTLSKEIAGSMTALPEIYRVSGPESSTAMIDVTHLTSPDKAREFIAGLTDWGTLTVEGAYIPANAVLIAIKAEQFDESIASNENEWQLDIAGSTTDRYKITAFVQSFSPNISLDEKKTFSLTLKITGKPTTLPS